MIDHDARSGPLKRCQVCGSSHLRLIIDLGYQPACDALLSSLDEPETSYPLRLMQCEECTLAQLDYVVPAEKVYPPSYPYKAGISWPVVQAHKEMALRLVTRFGKGHCVDIGSNDGTLLEQLRALGCSVTGVEPTDIAKLAKVPTVQAFFTERLAYDIEPAHIVTLTNVFAHMGDLGEVMRGICALLEDDGVLVIENHYLLDILERNQFDTIYHEHIRTYTLQSLMCLFGQYGLEVFHVERVPRYGGNIRVYVDRKGKRPIESSVGTLLSLEQAGLVAERWTQFARNVNRAGETLHSALNAHSAVACSAPGRASTLLNYWRITPELLRWTGEIPGSLKIGKFLPGCHIPIVSNERLRENQHTAVVLLAWHYADEIIARLRREGVTGPFIKPLPEFTEIE